MPTSGEAELAIAEAAETEVDNPGEGDVDWRWKAEAAICPLERPLGMFDDEEEGTRSDEPRRLAEGETAKRPSVSVLAAGRVGVVSCEGETSEAEGDAERLLLDC